MTEKGGSMSREKIGRLHDTAQFDKHVLSNGIVVWMQRKTIQTDYRGHLGVFLPKVGSVLDPPNKKGLAHFFEHMPFEGTEAVSDYLLNIKRVTERGGITHGLTSFDMTSYFAESHLDDAELVSETLYDYMSNPSITTENVESVKRVILREYEEKYAKGFYYETVDFFRAVFENNQLGNLPIGIHYDIKSIDRDDIASFFFQYYHAGNIQLVCGGSFSYREDMIGILESRFGKIRNGSPVSHDIKLPEKIQTGFIENLYDNRYMMNRTTVTHFIQKLSHRDFLKFRLIMDNISGNLDSPLVVELRRNKGRAYSGDMIQFLSKSQYDMVQFYCRVVEDSPQYFEDTYFKVLSEVDSEFFAECKLKKQLKRAISFEIPVEVCRNKPSEVLFYGKPISYSEADNQNDSLTIEEIAEARDFLLKNPPVIVRFVKGEKPTSQD